MKTKRSRWFLTFFVSLLLLVGIYYVAFDFAYLKYEVNDQNQFVMYEGLSGPEPVINSDVSNEAESLSVLGTYMEEFNHWVLVLLIIAPFFIATYAVLLSERLMKGHPKKRKYLSFSAAINLAVAGFFVFQWLRYAELVNDAYHNVMF
ncbi:hypothetical protein ERJ70_16605 [Sediminibacillus dalangtanensis]|uniref:Uncharacterized protein n=1 Tax=Sediminibacillus dalangtanensis TaxID=2729421 RepID=A0ABX7VYJ5_9BACI|nr:hypothetical protein [Sediminibacillus dalangtanensis]QTN00756.1 hypothetical protein ERJ70_16605 [Sediminibacillus dalangtanensis]